MERSGPCPRRRPNAPRPVRAAWTRDGESSYSLCTMCFLIRVGILALGLALLSPETGEAAYAATPPGVEESLTFVAFGQASSPPGASFESALEGYLKEDAGPEDLRVGLSFGGIGLAGLIFEYRWGDRSVEVNVGTWSLRDLSVSVVGKQYFGPGDFRPFTGVGLWAVVAPYNRPGERSGLALLARAPVGVDWNVVADHHLGAHLSLNRALFIRRKDPLDTTPPTARFVPLPGFYYVWNR